MRDRINRMAKRILASYLRSTAGHEVLETEARTWYQLHLPQPLDPRRDPRYRICTWSSHDQLDS